MSSPNSSSAGTSKQKVKRSRSDSSPTRRATEDHRTFHNSVFSYLKKAVVILAVWAAGVYRFSPSWLLVALAFYVWKERQQMLKNQAIAVAQEIARDERGAILARMEDLPSWVYFPDVERAEWVNKIINQMWPFIGQYVHKLLKESVEPNIRNSLPPSLGSFKFSRIDLGDIPPRISGVKVYTTHVRRDEIYLDLDLNYASDSNIAVQVKGMNFGIKDLTLRGMSRIILRPLINKSPLIGGMVFFFLNTPELDFNLTNMANAFELPGLNEILHSVLLQQIAELMVLPNRIPIQIADNVDIRKLRYPIPQGVVHVHMIEAQDLICADNRLLGKGKSDPYAIVSVGSQVFQTAVIKNTVNPVWHQTFEYVVDEWEGQVVKVEVRDQDIGSKDDPLGSTTVNIADIRHSGVLEEWLPLERVAKGRIHLRASWLYLSNDPAHLTKLQEAKTADTTCKALLIVNLDSAMDLPRVEDGRFKRGQGSLQEPSPFVLLTVGQVTQESSIRAATTDPCWEQNFRFFVANPNMQSLDTEVRDSKTKKALGELRVHLRTLLSAEDMFIERKFHLKSSQQDSYLYMSMVLRILTPHITHGWLKSEFDNIGEEPDEEVRSLTSVCSHAVDHDGVSSLYSQLLKGAPKGTPSQSDVD